MCFACGVLFCEDDEPEAVVQVCLQTTSTSGKLAHHTCARKNAEIYLIELFEYGYYRIPALPGGVSGNKPTALVGKGPATGVHIMSKKELAKTYDPSGMDFPVLCPMSRSDR